MVLLFLKHGSLKKKRTFLFDSPVKTKKTPSLEKPLVSRQI